MQSREFVEDVRVCGGDAARKDSKYALTTSEEVMEVTVYEADGMGDAVSDCLGCNFFRGDIFEKDDRDGHSCAGFYRLGTSGDHVEWTLDAEDSEVRPISFPHLLWAQATCPVREHRPRQQEVRVRIHVRLESVDIL